MAKKIKTVRCVRTADGVFDIKADGATVATLSLRKGPAPGVRVLLYDLYCDGSETVFKAFSLTHAAKQIRRYMRERRKDPTQLERWLLAR